MKLSWKVWGLIATVATGALSIAAGIIEDKKTEETIEEKVNEALARREGEES